MKSKNDNWRDKIRVGVIVDRFLKHFNGKIELSSTQIKAGQAILNKLVPDLKSVEHSGEQTLRILPDVRIYEATELLSAAKADDGSQIVRH